METRRAHATTDSASTCERRNLGRYRPPPVAMAPDPTLVFIEVSLAQRGTLANRDARGEIGLLLE